MFTGSGNPLDTTLNDLVFLLLLTVVCLLAFAGSTQPQLRGHLRGLGMSLGWGILYYIGVAVGQGMGKEGMLLLPPLIAVWAPHALAVWWSLRVMRRIA